MSDKPWQHPVFAIPKMQREAWRTDAQWACVIRDQERRAEDDWSFAFRPFIPPCVPLEEGIVEAMRTEIRGEVARLNAADEAHATLANAPRQRKLGA